MATEKSEYELQAEKFLEDTKTTIEIVFSHHGKHFDKDTDRRDIYDVTLTRENRKPYTFKFGQSISNSSLPNWKELLKTHSNKLLTELKNRQIINYYNVSISYYDLEQMVTGYTPKAKTIQNLLEKGKQPTSYDILTCLTKSEPGTFKDFCDDFGYSDDSINAKKVYENVRDEWLAVSRLFNDAELSQLMEIN